MNPILYCGLAASLVVSGCQATTGTRTSPSPTPTANATTPDAELRNTRWVLRALGGQPVPAPTNSEPYVLLRSTELAAEGNGSCNRFRGAFTLPAAGQLRFGDLLSTRMACASPEGNATESGFMQALSATRTYRISGDTLRLYGEAVTQPVALLHAVYLK
ncbi:META domain-containing protein [Hymenobacter psychrotolerans]|uniref:Heat shock protein HslJ n=1 Tax=Hymenobacter psychrotolerans DSM 18569 TaxID=1121959 RepID=A0A1M6VA02_9BACT|nr:META domain-containing protein [Hymenobacter psychrotolerans]SHK78211.1 Heat shock protein HslJ [Hymenobacter psychrotolerans DSM 18569]